MASSQLVDSMIMCTAERDTLDTLDLHSSCYNVSFTGATTAAIATSTIIIIVVVVLIVIIGAILIDSGITFKLTKSG